jgi:hypothetical protein
MAAVIASAKKYAASDKARSVTTDPDVGALPDSTNVAEITVPGGTAALQPVVGTEGVSQGPIDEVLTGGTVAENSPNGTVVGTVMGVEPPPDSGPLIDPIPPIFSYSLIDNAGGAFAISIHGQITVANSRLLDFERASSLPITVRVTDEDGNFFDKTLSINVSDVTNCASPECAPASIGRKRSHAECNRPGIASLM